MNAAKNLERQFNDGDIPRNDKNIKEVEKLLADFDRQQQKLVSEPSEVSNRREYESVKNKEPTVVKEKIWREGENKDSVPDYGAGVRETLYRDQGTDNNEINKDYKKQTKFDQSTTTDSWVSLDKYPLSDSSTDSTQLTAYNKYNKCRNDLLNSPLHSNALNVLNMHKQLLENGAQKKDTKNKIRERKSRQTDSVDDNVMGLLSLADIWNKNSVMLHSNPPQLLPKLQEEKLRRQHCEELIQELQNRNLELQQKLSVAVKVDDSKNLTIRQFQEALEKIITRMEKLNSEKQGWEQEMSKLKTRHSSELEEVSQKVAYYEKEASKALNLAHGNQEKLGSLERRSSDLQDELHSIEQKCKALQDDYAREVERNKQLSDILNQKEAELNDNKSILNDAKSEVVQSKRAVEVCQAEFTSMKNECVKLQSELQKERGQVIQLSEQKNALLNEVESYKRCEEELREEINRVKKQLESNKLELRNYYQGQVEILVQNKLTEFQGQLDRAENSFKEQTKRGRCPLPRLLPHTYSRFRKMQYKQQIDVLQGKLDQMHEKRIHIAKQLQKIMEAQWTEALRIITSGKSPTFKEEAFHTIDQLNSLKTKSYNNVEEVLAEQQEEHYNLVRKKNEAHFSMPNEETLSSINNNYEKNPQEFYSMPMDTPVSSRGQGSKKYNESDIQKYVNLGIKLVVLILTNVPAILKKIVFL
ncbi:hypothetical protein NQ314_011854 [Rhamnusium bicolor]|uniref:Uncharacterized protein n=1 Tax=Rhamnusium bicolor TaxID=1586634 RepID=A0AAV8XG08_9CUCU|nr:hypothetical protein NQ314_011854 [Rhamnusium bicolor]